MIKDTCSDPDSRFRMVQENVMQACNDPISASFGLQTDQQAPHTEAAPRPCVMTSRGSARMIVSVVMSSATRVPLTSFSLSSLVRTPTT